MVRGPVAEFRGRSCPFLSEQGQGPRGDEIALHASRQSYTHPPYPIRNAWGVVRVWGFLSLIGSRMLGTMGFPDSRPLSHPLLISYFLFWIWQLFWDLPINTSVENTRSRPFQGFLDRDRRGRLGESRTSERDACKVARGCQERRQEGERGDQGRRGGRAGLLIRSQTRPRPTMIPEPARALGPGVE